MDLKEKKISTQTIYDGKVIKLEVDEVLCPNGNNSLREVVRHCSGVCVLAKLDDKFIIERQYRYAYDKQIYELPAGKVEGDEDLLLAIKRELEEETGYYTDDITLLGSMYPSCGYTDEIIYLYYADNLIKTQTNFDDDEIIICEFKTMDELIKMISDGTIKDAKTICAINLYLIKNKRL